MRDAGADAHGEAKLDHIVDGNPLLQWYRLGISRHSDNVCGHPCPNNVANTCDCNNNRHDTHGFSYFASRAAMVSCKKRANKPQTTILLLLLLSYRGWSNQMLFCTNLLSKEIHDSSGIQHGFIKVFKSRIE